MALPNNITGASWRNSLATGSKRVPFYYISVYWQTMIRPYSADGKGLCGFHGINMGTLR
jgi:hypothetical protein